MGKSIKGKKAFDDYYRQIYGNRWNALSRSMISSSTYVALFESVLKLDTTPYYIDNASYFASTLALSIIREMKYTHILDMCSAPGGKLLGIIDAYLKKPLSFNHELFIISNEKSKNRFFRLQRNINTYINNLEHHDIKTNTSLISTHIHINLANRDGNLYGKHNKKQFDFVLLDAPCSNDAHVLENEKEIKDWNPQRCNRLTQIQTSLLCAAIDTCKKQGMVFYLTCSINPIENEKIIERVSKKRNIQTIQTDNFISNKKFETCEIGDIVLPDTSRGSGPLYMCIIKKL